MFPKERVAIKYLVTDGRYDYIKKRSLILIKEYIGNIVIAFEERHIKMYPLYFEELTWASSEDLLVDYIRKYFLETIPLK